MKRLEFLINNVRRTTNNKDDNKVTWYDMVDYFNRAQDKIKSIIFNSNNNNNIFNKVYTTSIVGGQEGYTLPSDVYGVNSISSVFLSTDGTSYKALDKISPKTENNAFGYYVMDNVLYLAPIPTESYTNGIRIIYNYILPSLSIRAAKVSGYNSGTGIISTTAFKSEISTVSDFICIVDSNGTITNEGLPINTFNSGTGAITTTTGLTIATNNYVVVGEFATTHCRLPVECETLLMNLVERMIFAVDSSSDVSVSSTLTGEELSLVTGLFQENSYDNMTVPITNTDFCWV